MGRMNLNKMADNNTPITEICPYYSHPYTHLNDFCYESGCDKVDSCTTQNPLSSGD